MNAVGLDGFLSHIKIDEYTVSWICFCFELGFGWFPVFKYVRSVCIAKSTQHSSPLDCTSSWFQHRLFIYVSGIWLLETPKMFPKSQSVKVSGRSIYQEAYLSTRVLSIELRSYIRWSYQYLRFISESETGSRVRLTMSFITMLWGASAIVSYLSQHESRYVYIPCSKASSPSDQLIA